MDRNKKLHGEAGADTREPGTPDKTSRDVGARVVNKSLRLPHERDQSTDAVASAPQDVMVQAKKDIDAGLVDTDMRATPGLDAEQREAMVPEPVKPTHPEEQKSTARKRKVAGR